MLPIIPKPAISVRQKQAALWVAGIVDFIQMPGFMVFGEGFLSPFQDVLDVVTAMILVAICGFRGQFVLAFGLELVPGLALFPSWTMVVLTMPTQLEGQGFEVGQEGQRVNVRRVDVEEPFEDRGSGPGVVDVEGTVVPPVQGPRVRGSH